MNITFIQSKKNLIIIIYYYNIIKILNIVILYKTFIFLKFT